VVFAVFAGKSNLMDAVSFVLRDKTTNTRASTLSVSIFSCGSGML